MRGESEGSSLHLYSPEDAAKSPTAPVVMEQGTPTVTVDIEGAQRDLILDTGSNISILQPGVSQSDVRCTSIKPYGVNGENLEIRSQQAVSFKLDGHEFKHQFYVFTAHQRRWFDWLGFYDKNRRKPRYREGQDIACRSFERTKIG